ncbi:MAG: hypothetical protein RIC16_06275 [Rhodospirillales bacterium]
MSETVFQNRPLPVWQTVKASYLVLFRNAGLALKLGFIPLVFGIIVAIYTFTETIESGRETEVTITVDLAFLSYSGPVIPLLNALLLVPAITAWHRLVLLGRDDPKSNLRYRIARAELAYVGRTLIAVILVLFVSLPITIPLLWFSASLASSIGPFVLFLIVPASAVLMAFCQRLALVFPATAISSKFSFIKSWEASENNTWRLFLALVITHFPFWVLNNLHPISNDAYFLLFSVALEPGPIAAAIFQVFGTFVWIASVFVMTSMWSWSYRYLVEGEDIVLPGERTA